MRCAAFRRSRRRSSSNERLVPTSFAVPSFLRRCTASLPWSEPLLVHGGAGLRVRVLDIQDLVPEALSSASTETVCSISGVSSSAPLVQPFPAAATATVLCLQLPCSRAPLCFTVILPQGMPRQALAVINVLVSCTASCIMYQNSFSHAHGASNNKPAPQTKRACSPRTRLYGTGTGPAHGQRKAW